MASICELPSCDNPAHARCSSCKLVYYCSVEHQKLHWRDHKLVCREVNTTKVISTSSTTATNSNPEPQSRTIEEEVTEKRSCRCMFCGDVLILVS